jgi:hypothetical protein
MDRIAKHVAGRLKAQPVPGPHPDSELLSAFAENVLPEADRGLLLQHLGACSDCREIVFLALPESAEAQKVLVLKPSRFRRWGLTWGAAVATVAIAAVLFTTERLEHKNQMAKMVAPASAPQPAADIETETGAEKKIAAEMPPPELDQMQAAREAGLSKKAVTPEENETKPLPPAKHMTGKMQTPLVFDQSGEVHMAAAAPAANGIGALVGRGKDKDEDKDKAEKQRGNLASIGVAMEPSSSAGKAADSAYATTASSAARAVQPAATGQQGAAQADALSESNADRAFGIVAPPKATVAGGNLGGIVSDPSGAAVGNAKVTTIGPAGAESATSDSQGKFSFDRLPPGLYSLTAEASGFKSAEIQQVAVLDNKTSIVPVTLEVGAASEVVEVTGAAPVVESSAALVAEPQQMAQFSMQKATAARAKGQAVGGPIGSGARVAMLQWTLSPKGAVQRSSDSGKTWQLVPVDGAAGFHALSAVGANIWVGGKAGVLYHSPDSGQTWVRVEPAAEGKKLDQDIVSLDFADGLVGTISTANGEVWTTSDGGQTWKRK